MSTITDRILTCILFAVTTLAVIGIAHVALTYKLVPRIEQGIANHQALRAATTRDAAQ